MSWRKYTCNLPWISQCTPPSVVFSIFVAIVVVVYDCMAGDLLLVSLLSACSACAWSVAVFQCLSRRYCALPPLQLPRLGLSGAGSGQSAAAPGLHDHRYRRKLLKLLPAAAALLRVLKCFAEEVQLIGSVTWSRVRYRSFAEWVRHDSWNSRRDGCRPLNSWECGTGLSTDGVLGGAVSY